MKEIIDCAGGKVNILEFWTKTKNRMRPVNNFTEIKKTSKNLKENKVKQKFIRLKSSCVKRYSLFFD